MKSLLHALLGQAVDALRADGTLPSEVRPDLSLERTRDRSHGDFASNVAMALARAARRKPRELAEALVAALPSDPALARVEIAGPGFINFFLAPSAYHSLLRDILDQGATFGHHNAGNGVRVQVEFVSANPTGPLHVGHGRGAAIGDTLCRLLQASGWDVTREFYYNDAGAQIHNLALSVQARARGLGPEHPDWPADGYRGDYISDVAAAFMAGETVTAEQCPPVTGTGQADDLDAIRRFAVAYLRREQDADLRAFGVCFDVYSLESALYDDGSVDATVDRLTACGHTYEQDGALWLRTTAFGDDKDRVMRKREGGYTYFVPDVAYHRAKWQRGFVRVINEQGADHHSTVTRVRAGLQALQDGIPAGWPEYVLHQMVTVLRGGEEVKISKRAGSYVTLRDLIDDVGRDATRLFLLMRKPDSQLVFDLDLARAQSLDNPVYYIQYAHARICSVFRQAGEKGLHWQRERGSAALDRLDGPHESTLWVALSRYPEAVEAAARLLEPHVLVHQLQDIAGAFHAAYNAVPFLVDDGELRDARLTLIAATRQVLANGLDLLGLAAPESM